MESPFVGFFMQNNNTATVKYVNILKIVVICSDKTALAFEGDSGVLDISYPEGSELC